VGSALESFEVPTTESLSAPASFFNALLSYAGSLIFGVFPVCLRKEKHFLIEGLRGMKSTIPSRYKGSSKCFRTFICSKKGGGGLGCHVTSQQGMPVDLAVNVRVAMKR
jgi:hypothetical protein